MYILLSTFVISLIAATVMFLRKLIMIREAKAEAEGEHFELSIPYIAEFREVTVKRVKRFGYVGLVTTIRLYFRSSNLLKSKYQMLKLKMKEAERSAMMQSAAGREVSAFLKTVSDYKQKIRKIKHRIKEEEKGV